MHTCTAMIQPHGGRIRISSSSDKGLISLVILIFLTGFQFGNFVHSEQFEIHDENSNLADVERASEWASISDEKRAGGRSFNSYYSDESGFDNKRGGARPFATDRDDVKRGGGRTFSQLNPEEKRAGARAFFDGNGPLLLQNSGGWEKRAGARAFFGGGGGVFGGSKHHWGIPRFVLPNYTKDVPLVERGITDRDEIIARPYFYRDNGNSGLKRGGGRAFAPWLHMWPAGDKRAGGRTFPVNYNEKLL